MPIIKSLDGSFLPIMGAFSLYHVYYLTFSGREWPLGTWFKGPQMESINSSSDSLREKYSYSWVTIVTSASGLRD